MSLSGRVALVTGASQGIGHACALKLAQSGAAVAVAARNQEKLNQLVHQIANTGGKAAAFPMDVADEEQIKVAFKATLAQFGKIDILVNNAGNAHEARRLGRGAQYQSDFRLSVHPAGHQFHAQTALGENH